MKEEINNSNEQDKSSIEKFSKKFVDLQNQSESSAYQTNKFNDMKKIIADVLKDCSKDTQNYNPQTTVEIIKDFLDSHDVLDRILYSEISNHIFGDSKRGTLNTNMDKLINYTYALQDKGEIDDRCVKWITKLYDHSQLAIYQIENQVERAQEIFVESNRKTKVHFEKQIKGIEKEYISILGIFASIILTFVGGMTFSTSVLQNISSVSIFRLLLTVDFLAVVLINTIYILIKFILVINEKNTRYSLGKVKAKRIFNITIKVKAKRIFNITVFNWACIAIAIIILIVWATDISTFKNFISQYIPWNK